MSKVNIVRAWKDPEYRLSLSEAERARLPDHPAGLIEVMDDSDLSIVKGGYYGGDGDDDEYGAAAASGCGSHHVCCTQDDSCPTKMLCPPPDGGTRW